MTQRVLYRADTMWITRRKLFTFHKEILTEEKSATYRKEINKLPLNIYYLYRLFCCFN